MTRGSVRIVLCAAGLAALASTALAQAPATAQVWDVQFVPDTSGPFAQGETSTGVAITMIARVGIAANGSASGTRNFGVSRVGGGNGTFFANFSDPAGGPFSSNAGPGPTGEGVDSNGQPLAGHFRAFRGGFAPQGTGGANNDTSNGIYSLLAGNPRATSVVGSRTIGFDGNALGVAVLDASNQIIGGEYVSVYRFLFLPKIAQSRNITLNISGLSARYIHTDNGGGFATAAAAVNLPNQSITFRVPTPGAAALVGLGGLAAMRRRRA